MIRKPILAAGLGAAAAAGVWLFLRPRPAPPNLVLISIDTLRADRVSCYGCETPTTPVLDRFADEAAVFTDAIVQSSWTLPSHMSLFTSLYPSTHKVGAASRTLDPAVVTLPLLLRKAGYATAAFVDAAFLSSRYGFSRGFDLYENAKGRGIETVLPRVESWLKTGRREPFFLFVHVFDCHCPYTPPADVSRRFSPDYGGDLDLSGRCGWSGFEDADLDEDDVRYISQQYDGEVYAVDRGLSRLLGLLEGLGLFENTVVVVTSDHGEEFMEHGRIGHTRSLYRELLRVPLIVRPAGGGPGRRIDRTVRGIDVAPTLLDLLGLPVPEAMQGSSLRPLLEGNAGGDAPAAYGELNELASIRTLIDGGYQYIANRDRGTEELYDLRRDPGETRNLAAERPEVARTMRRELEEIEDRARQAGAGFSPGKTDLSGKTVRELQALGYLQ